MPLCPKAIGEQGIAATAPAIANAIYHAVGVRIFDLPKGQDYPSGL